MDNSRVSDQYDYRFPYLKSSSFNYKKLEAESPRSPGGGGDRRFAFSRQSSFHKSAEPHTAPMSTSTISNNGSAKPLLSRTMSTIDIPPAEEGEKNINYICGEEKSLYEEEKGSVRKFSVLSFLLLVFRLVRSGNRPIKSLFVMISLNVAYSTAELCIGLITGRIGLVSDAFHLTFGCGILTFSLFAMAASREKPDRVYTYGYKRLEVLSAFTNATAFSFVHVVLVSCGSTSCIYTR